MEALIKSQKNDVVCETGGGRNIATTAGYYSSQPSQNHFQHHNHQQQQQTQQQQTIVNISTSLDGGQNLVSNSTQNDIRRGPGAATTKMQSHRKVSRWMRFSLILFASVILVFILFIVISPLLHYLM